MSDSPARRIIRHSPPRSHSPTTASLQQAVRLLNLLRRRKLRLLSSSSPQAPFSPGPPVPAVSAQLKAHKQRLTLRKASDISRDPHRRADFGSASCCGGSHCFWAWFRSSEASHSLRAVAVTEMLSGESHLQATAYLAVLAFSLIFSKTNLLYSAQPSSR